MDNAASPDATARFFDRLVLISNSIPKSGSTYLYEMQRNFLMSLCGKTTPNFSALVAAGVSVDGGYIFEPYAKEFLDFISNRDLTGGPYVLKTHALLNADLRQAILGSDHVFASFSIRDPLEVYFSARDNFRKSGEFQDFATFESGTGIVNGYFAKIYQTSVAISEMKLVPLVRYDQIVTDPVGALLASLHPTIKDQVMRRIAEGYLNLATAAEGAKERLNIGGLDRSSRDRSEEDYDRAAEALAETRQLFGYGG